MNYLLYYMIIINIIGLFVMGIDKSASKKRKARRISENSLFALALLGGSLGTTIGMYLFNHKTRKLSFTLGFPAIIVLHIIIGFYVWKWL